MTLAVDDEAEIYLHCVERTLMRKRANLVRAGTMIVAGAMLSWLVGLWEDEHDRSV